MIKEDDRLLTDVFVKSTDQYLYATQLPVMYTTQKKSISYSHALIRSIPKTIFLIRGVMI